jgi:hypothetical protein
MTTQRKEEKTTALGDAARTFGFGLAAGALVVAAAMALESFVIGEFRK